MSKDKKVEISVVTIFDGHMSEQQAFIDLILNKCKNGCKTIDGLSPSKYNDSKVFSDVHVGMRRE